jgi:voltage-gated sodium channel
MIIFYVASVIATNLFRHQFPEFFGDLGSTAFTLFQVMTLEGWSQDIVRPIMEVFPYAWIFFILFILIATFIVFNLFIAVIVDSITADKEKDDREEVHLNDIEDSIKALREEISELKRLLQK